MLNDGENGSRSYFVSLAQLKFKHKLVQENILGASNTIFREYIRKSKNYPSHM